MRHRYKQRKLNMSNSHRKAMFSNMCTSLIMRETIRTTLAKAKELRSYFEPMVTLGKDDSVAKRRRAFSKLRDDAAVKKLFTDIGPRNKTRPGGYIRILKCGFRTGDNAPMAIVELVEKK